MSRGLFCIVSEVFTSTLFKLDMYRAFMRALFILPAIQTTIALLCRKLFEIYQIRTFNI